MKRTGRDWVEWCALLDKKGAKNLSHREIARLIHEKYHGGDWWSQMITVGYERLRGRREVNQRTSGFAVSASKTIAVPAAAAFAAWADARRRAHWLAGVKLIIRTATAPRSVRLTCDDGTNIEGGDHRPGARPVPGRRGPHPAGRREDGRGAPALLEGNARSPEALPRTAGLGPA